MSLVRKLRAGFGVVLLAVAGPVGLAGSGSAAPGERNVGLGERYVALGDSYTAGSFIPVQVGTPSGCERSDHNYPSLVRAALGSAAFTDASCGGATTANLVDLPQPVAGGTNPPQRDALAPGTDLVTVGIGANDIGFAEIVTACTARSPLGPLGAACLDHFRRHDGRGRDRDVLADRIDATGPKVAAALRAVRERAPGAVVLVVGYPTVLPPGGGLGCAPISAGDAEYLSRTFRSLNAMLRAEADRAGLRYVDVEAASVGHDVCQPPGVRWVEGAVATSPAAPWHPNAAGMRATADQVLATLRGPG